MGTRGFIGKRNNKKLWVGNFNSHDSYYDGLGKEAIDYYFKDYSINILELTRDDEDDIEFLQDGLFCEYAYVYNEDNDTLEIYRGYFKAKQEFCVRNQILNALEEKKEKEYFCHLIMIIDKKKHTEEKVIKAFEKYNTCEDENIDYPEREIIPLELPKNYIQIV